MPNRSPGGSAIVAHSRRRPAHAAHNASRAVLNWRLHEVADTRLTDVLGLAPHLHDLFSAFARLLGTQRVALTRELAGRADRRRRLALQMAAGMRAFVCRQYPYVEVTPAHDRVLWAVYARLVDAVVATLASDRPWLHALTELRDHLTRHQAALRTVADTLLADAGANAADAAAIPVCAEYRPSLQLAILGTRADELAGPLLDLGCGASGALVRHLRAHGCEPALGVDRAAPRGAGFLRASWFDVPLEPEAWGTIVSHHAFSLYFLHAHRRAVALGRSRAGVAAAARAARYAARYGEVLRALRPGGRLYYAPALPFVEAYLPAAEYRVTTRSAVSGVPPVSAAVRDLLDTEPAARLATVVERLA
jgi:hypothetical protein